MMTKSFCQARYLCLLLLLTLLLSYTLLLLEGDHEAGEAVVEGPAALVDGGRPSSDDPSRGEGGGGGGGAEVAPVGGSPTNEVQAYL